MNETMQRRGLTEEYVSKFLFPDITHNIVHGTVNKIVTKLYMFTV